MFIIAVLCVFLSLNASLVNVPVDNASRGQEIRMDRWTDDALGIDTQPNTTTRLLLLSRKMDSWLTGCVFTESIHCRFGHNNHFNINNNSLLIHLLLLITIYTLNIKIGAPQATAPFLCGSLVVVTSLSSPLIATTTPHRVSTAGKVILI